MTREEAIDKVAKILRFKDKAGTEEEAISNILIAQRIMAKYDIDLDEIEQDQILDDFVAEEVYEEKYKTCKWKYILASVLAPNFRCRMSANSGKGAVVFYGHISDVEILKRVYSYLLITGTELAKREFKRYKVNGKSAIGVKNTYYVGFLRGIESALSEQCTALMVSVPSDVNEEFGKLVSGFKKKKNSLRPTVDGNVYNKGFEDGRSAVKSRAIEEGDSEYVS